MTTGVKFISYYDWGGYFNASKAYMLALIERGIPLTWTPVEFGKFEGGRHWRLRTGHFDEDQDLQPYYNREIEYDTVIIHLVPELYPYVMEREPNKRYIGYTTWETDRIKPFWLGPISMCDHLLVPSRWNKQAFETSGVSIPIDVIPHLVNKDISSTPQPEPRTDQDAFVFYTINTWTYRKNIEALITAYLEAFTANDPVKLILKTTKKNESRFTRPHFFERFVYNSKFLAYQISQKYKSPAKIEVINRRIAYEDILALHARGDSYISLTHAEGWGLGAYDAAAFGNPVIITGYGGQLDFLPPDLSYWVDYELVLALYPERDKNFYPGERWAEPSIEHASQLMRHVYENRAEATEKGRRLKQYVVENFQEDVIMEKFISIINR